MLCLEGCLPCLSVQGTEAPAPASLPAASPQHAAELQGSHEYVLHHEPLVPTPGCNAVPSSTPAAVSTLKDTLKAALPAFLTPPFMNSENVPPSASNYSRSTRSDLYSPPARISFSSPTGMNSMWG